MFAFAVVQTNHQGMYGTRGIKGFKFDGHFSLYFILWRDEDWKVSVEHVKRILEMESARGFPWRNICIIALFSKRDKFEF